MARAGPAPAQVWGLFGLAAVVTLAVVYGLVARWGLASWTLGLAGGLLAIGGGVLVATGGTPSGILAAFSKRRAAFTTEDGSRSWGYFDPEDLSVAEHLADDQLVGGRPRDRVP